MAINFLPNNNFLYKPVGAATITISNPVYEPRAVFSINASNQLQGTFWVTKNGERMTSNLGSLDFTIRDHTGATIGIAQTGLTADSHGFYYMAPVLATAIQDLTHYAVEIIVTADAQLKKGAVAITLGE